MMMNNVVKLRQFSCFLKSFSDIIKSDKTNMLARTRIHDFSRRRVMSFDMVIFYLIFRNRKNTDADLIKFFSALDILEKKVTRQALHKNIRKLNPSVFLYLFKQFASLFYSSGLGNTYRGYTILSEDGTFIEIPYMTYNIYYFGIWENKTVRNMFDVRKIISKSGGLYDVTNGFFVDFTMRDAPSSEIPLAFRHLYNTAHLYNDKKVIYLADRYYGSMELIAFLESLNYKYCIRAKSNFYKKQISEMKRNDDYITVHVDRKWLERMTLSYEARNYIENNPNIRIRVVRKPYVYYDRSGRLAVQEMTYFTNLSKDEFDKRAIEELYSKRWDIETAYRTLKTQLELERHISRDVNVSQSCVYAKVLFFNIAGVERKMINNALLSSPKITRNIIDDNVTIHEYKYSAVNITQMINCIYENNILKSLYEGDKRKLAKKIYQILKACEKMKVPIRENRHYERWGRVVPSGYYYRFSLDGRNFPKCKTIKGVMRTTRP